MSEQSMDIINLAYALEWDAYKVTFADGRREYYDLKLEAGFDDALAKAVDAFGDAMTGGPKTDWKTMAAQAIAQRKPFRTVWLDT